MARRRHDSLVCDCCGQWAPSAHDPDTDGEWVVQDDEVICYAGAALQRWRDEENKTEPGARVYVRRLSREEIGARRGD